MAYLSSWQGDYLRGYRGDPFLGGIWRGIKGAVTGFARGGPIGAIGGAVSAVTGRSRPMRTTPIYARGGTGRQAFPGGSRIQPTPGIRGGIQRLLPGGKTGYEVVSPRRRRMNVANPKALRRAIRRQAGFVKLARRALKGSGYTVVSRGSRSRPRVSVRESGPGSVTVR